MERMKLFDKILNDLISNAEDRYGHHKPEYFQIFDGHGIEIITEYSRNPSRSNNGGDYYYYSRYYPLEDGRIIRETKSSYEDSSWKITDIYSVCLSKNALSCMADLAIRKINNSNIPINNDINELKKKIISYINGMGTDESSGEYFMAIAGLLGLDFEDGINF